jgi:hypothetical protein
MDEKFWSKSTRLTAIAAVVYVIVATGVGMLITNH